RPYLAPLEPALGVSADEILSWGQAKNGGSQSPLSMFVLALRMAQYINGVSRLHGKTARKMWSHLWPEIPQEEVPITHVTNGVHSSSWVSPENAMLFEQYLGPDWQMRPSEPSVVDRVDAIYGGELWRAHEMSRTRLIRTCREIMLRQYGRRNAPISMMRDASSVLDQDILTIGFARRFATYKRAYLLFMDPDRLEALVTNPEKPVQIVLAGKAHPKDNEGKGLIQQLIRFARRPALRRHVIFLEDYDIQVARCLVQGADVWLNTPRIPLEACGTSGMKAALNGVLNLSVLDGWWAEGFDRNRGWAIGQGEEYADHGYQDAVESQALFNVLENDVIPCFYDRKESDIPLRWVSMMKQSIKMALEHFSAHCMVGRYDELFYRQALENAQSLCLEDAREAKEHKAKHRWLKEHWSAIRVEQPQRDGAGMHRVGESFLVMTRVYLGQLKPSEVEVHLYYGLLQSMDTLVTGDIEAMTVEKDHGGGFYTYACTVECKVAGRYGYTARVMPAGDGRIRFAPGLVTWA
ncbi:MAG: alpha-glucan family phosphorylase, partial [Desulfatibacillaceae bacterium]|nr:alpha-glucan family phosphorylase [Desulfatibacillaceae bacterium]